MVDSLKKDSNEVNIEDLIKNFESNNYTNENGVLTIILDDQVIIAECEKDPKDMEDGEILVIM